MDNGIKNLKPSGKSKFRQGLYKVIHPEKYVGDVNNVIYRSGWEKKFCIYCDNQPSIIEWSSEPFKIKYLNGSTFKEHTYYTDFYIKIQDSSDKSKKYIVNINQESQNKKPEIQSKRTLKALNSYKYNLDQYVKNQSKWVEAKRACEDAGFEFMVITEKFLNKL